MEKGIKNRGWNENYGKENEVRNLNGSEKSKKEKREQKEQRKVKGGEKRKEK